MKLNKQFVRNAMCFFHVLNAEEETKFHRISSFNRLFLNHNNQILFALWLRMQDSERKAGLKLISSIQWNTLLHANSQKSNQRRNTKHFSLLLSCIVRVGCYFDRLVKVWNDAKWRKLQWFMTTSPLLHSQKWTIYLRYSETAILCLHSQGNSIQRNWSNLMEF